MDGIRNNDRAELSQDEINFWQELPRLSVVIMELCWIVPWFQMLTLSATDISPLKIGIIFGFIIILAHLLVRLVFQYSLKENVRRGVILAFILLAVIFSIKIILYSHNGITDLGKLYNVPLDSIKDFRELIPPEVMVILYILLIVQRGFSFARNWSGANTVINSIQLTVVMLVIFGVLGKATSQIVIEANLYIFLVAAIFGMITARIGSIVSLRGGRGVQIDPHWLGSIFTTTVLITGLAASIAVFSSGQSDRIFQVLRLIFYTAFIFVATPFFTLVSQIFPTIEGLQQALLTPESPTNIPEWEQGANLPPQGNQIENAVSNSVEYLLQLRFILFVILVILAIIFIVRMTRTWSIRYNTGVDDERDSLFEGRNLLSILLDAFRNRIKHTANNLSTTTLLNRRDRIRAAARIRRIYADFMELSENLGQGRKKSQTPQEFLPIATQFFPQSNNELHLITDSYQRIRYGELPESIQDVNAVEEAWKHVLDVGGQLKKQLNR
jgi:hypothetical protein